MDYSKFWCITWNPARRDLSTERLDKYIEANQASFMDGDDLELSEVLLEVFDNDDPILMNERIKYWREYQIEPPPIKGIIPEE